MVFLFLSEANEIEKKKSLIILRISRFLGKPMFKKQLFEHYYIIWLSFWELEYLYRLLCSRKKIWIAKTNYKFVLN